MKKEIMKSGKIWTLSLCLFFLFNLIACNEADQYGYDNIDSDRDEMLNEDEFSAELLSAGYYDKWDDNGDGVVGYDEFYDRNYGVWDQDEDGIVDESEWGDGITSYIADFTPDVHGDWKTWDVNSNNKLDLGEFTNGLTNARYHELWDRNKDNQVNQEEFREGLFAAWDRNNNGRLEKEEYVEGYQSYFGTKE